MADHISKVDQLLNIGTLLLSENPVLDEEGERLLDRSLHATWNPISTRRANGVQGESLQTFGIKQKEDHLEGAVLEDVTLKGSQLATFGIMFTHGL
jgi:hypothetical protein